VAIELRRTAIASAGRLAAQLLRAKTTTQDPYRMPSTSESPSTYSRREFCLSLKAARERNGVTLAQIAHATKIPTSLFAALERNDLRCWPNGLFRRAFFREYVRMIGLPVASTCDEFVHLFCDEEPADAVKTTGAANVAKQEQGLRLALDDTWHGPRSPVLSRCVTVLMDAAAVALLALAIAWVGNVDQSNTAAAVALAYLSVRTMLSGVSPIKWAATRHWAIVEVTMQGAAVVAAAWKRGADATVESAPSPRLRVRIVKQSP
jgi:hypothetical protein